MAPPERYIYAPADERSSEVAPVDQPSAAVPPVPDGFVQLDSRAAYASEEHRDACVPLEERTGTA